MNHIELRYSFFSPRANLNINGEPISTYSQLSTLLTRPFPETISNILGELDKEVFDDYEIDFYGSEFQYQMLKNTAATSEYCKGIIYHKSDTLFSAEETLKRLLKICQRHSIALEKPQNFSLFFSETDLIPMNIPEEFHIISTPSADVGFFRKDTDASNNFSTVVIVDGDNKVLVSRNKSIYHISEEDISSICDFFKMENIITPTLTECFTVLKYAKLDSNEQIELDSIKNNTPAYYMSNVPTSLDQGDTASVNFECFPPNAYTLVSGNSSLLSVKNNVITGNLPGTCSLIVKDANGNNIFSKDITIISHLYAEEIRLVPRFKYLKRSERNQIDVIVTPYNAEDINELQWEISNPQVIHVDKGGNIVALENGKSVITVCGKKVNASIEIEVKPELQGLHFTQQSIRLKSGETVVLDCEVTPADAHTENLTWEIDNETIASINPSKTGKRCQVIASTNYEGKGNIRCYDTESKLGAICNIEIISKVRPNTAGKIALVCWLAGVFIPFLLPISAIASFYGLIQDPEPDHHARYIICAIGSIITLIFWIAISLE